MATTTLKAIIDRVQAVCEAAPLHLVATAQPLSFDTQPAAALDHHYYVEDVGLGSSASVTNDAEVRIDRLKVWLALRHTVDGQAQVETMSTTLNTLERYVLADGPANSYMATLVGREITRADESSAILAALEFEMDYDYTTSTD